MNLKNKVAIVTGSSKGLGVSIVEKLLEQGVFVAGFSRSETKISHPNFISCQVDISDEKQIETTLQEVKQKFGSIDIIINNAGFGAYEKVEDLDSDTLRKMFETNVFGIFYLTKLVVPEMKKAKYGHIVNISSIAGITGIEKMSAYNATKFAVKGMSESLFKELRPDGIKVTCILPGSIETNFFDDLGEQFASSQKMDPNDVADSILFCLESNSSFHPVNIELRPFNTPK